MRDTVLIKVTLNNKGYEEWVGLVCTKQYKPDYTQELYTTIGGWNIMHQVFISSLTLVIQVKVAIWIEVLQLAILLLFVSPIHLSVACAYPLGIFRVALRQQRALLSGHRVGPAALAAVGTRLATRRELSREAILIARVISEEEVVRRGPPLVAEEHVDLEVATEAA